VRRWFDHPLGIAAIATVWWTLIALMGAVNASGRGGYEGGWAGLRTSLAAVSAWIPLTVGIHALVRWSPLRGPRWRRALAIHGAGCAAVIVLRAVFIHSLDPWVGWYPETPPLSRVLMHSVENNFFVYWLFVGVGHAAIYARDAVERSRAAAELQVALSRAELSALASTLQPHFLFNTLGAIAELVHRDPAAADRAIVQLSAMMRRLIDDRRQVVPLRDELAFVRDYLEIEQVRFGDRLTVSWDVAPELLDAPVPRLSIQPLVENALRHGLWPAGRPGTLVIAARADGATLTLTVTDDGVGPITRAGRTGTDPLHGLGLVRARVERLYADRGRLDLVARREGGARAELVVPW
jgi:hypothetical protein